jgi:Glycosyl transferase family 2
MWARVRNIARARLQRRHLPVAHEAFQSQSPGIPALDQLEPQPAPSETLAWSDLRNVQQELEAQIQRLRDENNRLSDLVSSIAAGLDLQRIRVDYVLSEAEGLGGLRSLLSEARRTAEFQSVFDEACPLVSVLVATANRPHILIDRCLRSILDQTYQNLQIIVVGDHCTDETPNLIDGLQDSRIQFCNLDQRGPYPRPGIDRWYVAGTRPLIAAQSMARGHFITYLDDDDRWERKRVEIMVDVVKRHRAELIWHKFWYLLPDGTWQIWGNGKLEHCQVGLQMVFYHRFFLQVPWDVYSYRIPEPNDWNHLRKIWHLRPKAVFIDEPLTWYHKAYEPTPFEAQEGETFLD